MDSITNVNILLDEVEKVGEFVNIMYRTPVKADIKSKTYKVNAKSIMGILSLDLTHPVELIIHATGNDADAIISKVQALGVMAS